MQRSNRTLYAVLGFLTWGPMSGYDVKKLVETSTANFWTESYGQIYPILRTLAERGLARRVADSRARTSARERQAYEITARGRAELQRWLVEPTGPPTVRNELLLKLFFSRQVDPSDARRQVEDFRRHVNALVERGVETRTRLEGSRADAPDLPYWLLTLRFGEIQRAAVLTWCDEALATLDRLAKTTARADARSRTRGSNERSTKKPRGATTR